MSIVPPPTTKTTFGLGTRRASARGVLAVAAVLVAGCSGTGAVPPAQPSAAPSVTTSSSPVATATAPAATATVTADPVPPGRILFHRLGPEEVEAYFTIDTDGTNEQALFELQGCGCARLSPDGSLIWTMGATGHGTYSFTTMRLDGSQREVVSPPSRTLNLGPAATNADGSWLAFDGWDETDPSRNGLYLGAPDLANVRLVMALPEGAVRTEPFAVTPDGSRVLFFLEEEPQGHGNHAGSLFVIDADGTGLRKLNPAGTFHNWMGEYAGALSPDGRQVAFAVDDAVFIADLDNGGEARRITDRAGFAWAVTWSPTGEWISYTRQRGAASVISLVRPDGTEHREISTAKVADESASGAWSPDGKFLLVRRGPDGHEDLWILALDGTFVGRVTSEPSNYRGYGWAAGGG